MKMEVVMGTPMDRTNRYFISFTTFEKAFPELEDAIIEYVEGGPYDYPLSQENRKLHSLKNQGPVICCGNTKCRQGGYEIDFDVRDMIRDSVSEREGNKVCPGSEGSPQLRKVYRKCCNSIDYKISLIYKKK
jgi:hypothetical protein